MPSQTKRPLPAGRGLCLCILLFFYVEDQPEHTGQQFRASDDNYLHIVPSLQLVYCNICRCREKVIQDMSTSSM